MTRRWILCCVVCLLGICCVANALADPARFTAGEFEATLPEGWQAGYSEGETTYYFRNSDFSLEDGVIILQVERSDALSEDVLTDDFITVIFNTYLRNTYAEAVDGKVVSLESRICGRRSLVLWYRKEAEGEQYALAQNIAATGTGLFEIMMIHPAMEPEELRDIVLSIGESVQYSPPGNDAEPAETAVPPAAVLSREDLPVAEDPHPFTPLLTAGEDLLAAQWMMNESTRAMCTVYLTLDLVLDSTPLFEAFPMNVFESRIGLSGDTIRIIVQSQDEQTAYIVLYDTVEQSALFYAAPWDESTLETFEQACTDQFWENTDEGLNGASQRIMETYGE